MAFELRADQVPIVEHLWNQVKLHPNGSGYVVMPTGVGKTILFSALIDLLHHANGRGHHSALILVPNNHLLEQTRRKLEMVFGREPQVGFYYGGKKVADQPITIATVQSWQQHPDAFLRDRYQLIIADEAHEFLSDRRRALLAEFSGYKMGFTATPATTQHHVSEILGTQLHFLLPREAIELGYLPEMNYYRLQTNLSMAGVRAAQLAGGERDYSERELARKVNVPKRNIAAVETYLEMHAGQPAIMFASSVRHAQELAEMLRKRGVTAEAVTGGMSPKAVEEATERCRHGVVTTVYKLMQGWDAPYIRAVYLLRPTLSPRIFFQQLGRGLRSDEGKDSVDVVDAVDNWDEHDFDESPITFRTPLEISGRGKSGVARKRPDAPLIKLERSHVMSELDYLYYISHAANPDFSVITHDDIKGAIRSQLPHFGRLSPPQFMRERVALGGTTYYVAQLLKHPELVRQITARLAMQQASSAQVPGVAAASD